MNTEHVNEIAGFVLALAAIPAVATAFIYGLGSPWWQSTLGRVMFAKWTTVALVLVFVVARRTWGDFPGYEWLALVIYSFTLVTFTATTIEVIIERRGPDDGSIAPKPKEKYMAVTTTVPDVWYKAQRVLRTIVQSLVVLVPTVNLAAAALINYLNEQEGVAIPGWVFLWLNGIVVVTSLVMGAVARLMLVPGVNQWLTKLGLGSVPESALTPVVKPSGEVVTVVEPDPKVVG